VVSQAQRIVTPVTWIFAPEWLTLDEACHLSGHSRDDMLFIVEDGGVDTNDAGLIEKQSLYEFQEALLLLRHWVD
jgi:hypothetical protein